MCRPMPRIYKQTSQDSLSENSQQKIIKTPIIRKVSKLMEFKLNHAPTKIVIASAVLSRFNSSSIELSDE